MKRLLVIVALHFLHLCGLLGDTLDSSNGTVEFRNPDLGFKLPWWFGLVVGLVILPIIIYLLYKCFHPRSVMHQFLKSQGLQLNG